MVKESDLMECVLESIKAHVAAVVSMEALLEGSDAQKRAQALASG